MPVGWTVAFRSRPDILKGLKPRRLAPWQQKRFASALGSAPLLIPRDGASGTARPIAGGSPAPTLRSFADNGKTRACVGMQFDYWDGKQAYEFDWPALWRVQMHGYDREWQWAEASARDRRVAIGNGVAFGHMRAVLENLFQEADHGFICRGNSRENRPAQSRN